MKQNITFEEYIALPEESQNILSDWMFEHGYDDDSQNPKIGHMIEFIDEHRKGFWSIENLPAQSPNDIEWGLFLVRNYDKSYRNQELCDALWKAVKETLEDL